MSPLVNRNNDYELVDGVLLLTEYDNFMREHLVFDMHAARYFCLGVIFWPAKWGSIYAAGLLTQIWTGSSVSLSFAIRSHCCNNLYRMCYVIGSTYSPNLFQSDSITWCWKFIQKTHVEISHVSSHYNNQAIKFVYMSCIALYKTKRVSITFIPIGWFSGYLWCRLSRK